MGRQKDKGDISFYPNDSNYYVNNPHCNRQLIKCHTQNQDEFLRKIIDYNSSFIKRIVGGTNERPSNSYW